MIIGLVAISAGLLGAGIAVLAMRFETINEFEIEEFKKFSDVFGGRK